MYREPREQIKYMINQISYIDSDISDVSLNQILKFLVKEILKANPSGWYNNGYEWEIEFLSPINSGWVDAEKYWNYVLIIIDEF